MNYDVMRDEMLAACLLDFFCLLFCFALEGECGRGFGVWFRFLVLFWFEWEGD